MRYFLEISFDGRNYHGWQTQPNDVSVQQTIESALSTILRTPTPIVGAGRTDAGVNARQMFAHFDYPNTLNHTLLRALNSLVGPDIAVSRIIPVADDAHARFDATARTYRYFVHHSKDPFLSRFSLQTAPLDYELMNRAAAMLLDVSDFTSFAKLHSDAKTNICHVSRALWLPAPHLLQSPEAGEAAGRLDSTPAVSESSKCLVSNPEVSDTAPHYFEITADRFLRNMVRAVVGTLVEVGRHKTSLERFAEVITRRDRCAAGTSMPAHALFLWRVSYPYL